MTEPIHTPFLKAACSPEDSLQRTKIYGPKHPDGGEHAPVCEIALKKSGPGNGRRLQRLWLRRETCWT